MIKLNSNLEKRLDLTVPIEYVNNIDFYKDISAIDFLRDIGRHYRVTSMLQKDSVKTRIQQNQDDPSIGLSFTEFSYQIF